MTRLFLTFALLFSMQSPARAEVGKSSAPTSPTLAKSLSADTHVVLYIGSGRSQITKLFPQVKRLARDRSLVPSSQYAVPKEIAKDVTSWASWEHRRQGVRQLAGVHTSFVIRGTKYGAQLPLSAFGTDGKLLHKSALETAKRFGPPSIQEGLKNLRPHQIRFRQQISGSKSYSLTARTGRSIRRLFKAKNKSQGSATNKAKRSRTAKLR